MIQLNRVNFSYDYGEHALKDINLHINAGECVLLLGKSGSGKTSLMRVMNGLIPKFYPGDFSGDVLINGKPMEHMSMMDLSILVGSVFQNPRNQFFTLDTTSEIAFSLENQGILPNIIRERVHHVFKALNLQQLKDRELYQLSGGQMQAIAIASVCALNPHIVILDEPSANLDRDGISELVEILKKLKAAGKTIIISEHRIYYLRDVVDRAIYIKEGCIERMWCGEDFYNLDERARHNLGLRALNVAHLTLNNQTVDVEGLRLQLKDVSVGYRKKLLDNINLTVRSGKVVGIVGGNGVGKTSLFHVISGLRKALSGHIVLNGKRLNRKMRQKKCAVVMQDPSYQFFMETVEAELLMGRQQDRVEDITNVLSEMNLLEKRHSDPLKLSGGEKQRLAVAISLMDEKEVFLFDEPSSGLDYQNMKNLAERIKALQTRGKIVLIISHDFELLSEVCTHLWLVEKGGVTVMDSFGAGV